MAVQPIILDSLPATLTTWATNTNAASQAAVDGLHNLANTALALGNPDVVVYSDTTGWPKTDTASVVLFWSGASVAAPSPDILGANGSLWLKASSGSTRVVMQKIAGVWTSVTTIFPVPTIIAPPVPLFVTTKSGRKVSYNSATSSTPEGVLVNYEWDFGDGTAKQTSTAKTIAHTYATDGTFATTLKVTNDSGLSSTKTKNVTVKAPVVVTPPTGTQPTGSGISRIQDLSGSNLNTQINSTTNKVSFANGSYTFRDFANPASQTSNPHQGRGLFINKATGLLGTSRDGSVLSMVPGSTSKTTDMSISVTYLMYVYVNSQCKVIQDLTLLGISIGDLAKLANGQPSNNGNNIPSQDSPFIYHGFYLDNITGLLMKNVLIKNIPASDHVNPGETGPIATSGGSGTFDTVEIAGGNVGGTGFLMNNSSGVYNWKNCYVHDLKYSCAISFYKMNAHHTVTGFKSVNNRTAFNHEANTSLSVDYISPIISGSLKHDFSFGSSTGSTKVNIYDPVDLNGKPLTKISCGIIAGYSSQKQVKSDVRAFRNGVDVTSSVIVWN